MSAPHAGACIKCGSVAYLNHSTDQCADCDMMAGSEQCAHGRMIRCPWCAAAINPVNEPAYFRALTVHDSGVAELRCPECHKPFDVYVSVTHHFISPAQGNRHWVDLEEQVRQSAHWSEVMAHLAEDADSFAAVMEAAG